MNSRERVAVALQRHQPDRVPHCELGIDRALAQQIMGWGAPLSQAANLESNPYSAAEAKSIAQRLQLDNLSFVLRAPVYAERIPGMDGRLFYGEGQIQTEKEISKIQLPDPHDEALYEPAKRFLDERGNYSTWFVTRLGIFPTMLSLGTENFSIALYENRRFVETVLDIYCEWTATVAKKVCGLGFDAFVTTDDMAFKSAPFFSPRIFHELVLPRYRMVAKNISLPWIIHSDGNIIPFLDDLLSLGIAGLHPLEKGAVDIAAVKNEYGQRLCLLGNLDLNILGLGTEEEVAAEVRYLISTAAPGGGYIITSGNSLAGYLKPENVLAFTAAVEKYGHYPLNI